MTALSGWSAGHVVVFAAAWPLLVLVYFFWRLNRVALRPGVGVLGGDLTVGLLILLGPPVLLVTLWFVMRLVAGQ